MLSSYIVCSNTPRWTEWFSFETEEYMKWFKNESRWAKTLVQQHYQREGFTELIAYGYSMTAAEFLALRQQLQYLFAHSVAIYFDIIKK
jgi:hypothetical protein